MKNMLKYKREKEIGAEGVLAGVCAKNRTLKSRGNPYLVSRGSYLF
jgi:hypothetical protein